jgi:hypothetical protein
MRITVITDSDGRILGTAASPEAGAQTQPVSRLIAGPGQTAHEIDLPDALGEFGSAEDFHDEVRGHLPSTRRD